MEASISTISSTGLSPLSASPCITQEINEEIERQRRIAHIWIDNNQHDYAAHAIWKGNLPSIIEDGAVRPAEDVLRQKGEVEHEAGMYDCRCKRKLPTLSEDDLIRLEKLGEKKSTRLEALNFLKSKDPLTPQEHLQLQKFDNIACAEEVACDEPDELYELQQKLYSAAEKKDEEQMQKLQTDIYNFRMNHCDNLPEIDRQQYKKLAENEWLSYGQNRGLNSLLNRKQGIDFFFKAKKEKPQLFGKSRSKKPVKIRVASIRPNFKRNRIVEELAQKYNTSETEIQIAYDLQSGNYLDKHLTHKNEKWTKKKVPQKIIDQAIYSARIPGKCLKVEVSTGKNGISWAYGNTVVLRGKTENISTYSRSVKAGRELLLLTPWQNKGEFFRLPLAQEDTLILGPRQVLEPHVARLRELNAQYVFIESLSIEQNDFFSTPKNLRDPT